MFRNIVNRIKRDKDYPLRQFAIDVYSRVLDGAIYDHLPHSFHEERNEGNGEYIPLRDRRPSVRCNLCKTVVEDSVSLLFSEGHFPKPTSDTEGASEALQSLIKAGRLNEVMIEAATTGSVGSAAIQMRILEQRDKSHKLFYDVHSTEFLTPTFDPADPTRLIKIVEKYKVRGDVLRERGYVIADQDTAATFWFSREWDETSETWFLPWSASDANAGPVVDTSKGVTHGLGFVPWVWIRNLPGKMKLLSDQLSYSDIDGAGTFAAAIETMIEIEYLLSQGGRGLKYTADPLLIIKEPAAPDEQMVRSPNMALITSADGDAKLLEIGGTSFAVLVDYVKVLREIALESIHGNRAEASKLSAAQSGKAMELLNLSLIWIADRLRISYGEGALVELLRMAIAGHARFPLSVDGKVLAPVAPDADITLHWPAWYHKTSRDLQEEATTIKTLRDAKVISRETAVGYIAPSYDIEDTAAELAKIEQDAENDIAIVADAATPNVTEQVRVSE